MSQITKVYLLCVPLENDYKNTLYFSSEDAQQSYFLSRIVRSYTDFSYQRKDSSIRVPCHFDDLKNVNYVMYQNSRYSNKWFYAFITDMKYVNDERTDVYIETDYIQTWFFDVNVKASFVEREHVSNDDIGKHLLEEGLELGEYVCNSHIIDEEMDSLLSDICYVIGMTISTTKSGDKYTAAGGGLYNGIYSGVRYYRFDTVDAINEILENIAGAGQSDAITGIFMCPKFLAPISTSTGNITTSKTTDSYVIEIEKNYGLDGYTPQNNKLKTYPYSYLVASNNQGSNAVYKYEDFSTDNCQFLVNGALTPGCSIRMTPTSYKGIDSYDEESLNLGKFPICNFSVDMYTNWLTQNSVNIGGATVTTDSLNINNAALNGIMQTLGGIGMIATGAGALSGIGSVASGVAGGVTNVANALIQQKQHELVPPQARGNLNSGDVITASSKNNFHFYTMSIKSQYAKIIDKYFHMFGYKVNMVKVPNKAHRARWWYTKTIDVNIDGAIPQKDLQVIKNCYNNGITFWRSAGEIQNYSLLNIIHIQDGAVTDDQ